MSEQAKARLSRAAVVGLAALVVADRLHWAGVAQWREDQATNLWLGLQFFSRWTPVGLISSSSVPNPNGMPLLGAFLCRLPGLFEVSVAIGCLQAACAVWCFRELRRRYPLPALLCLPLLTAIPLRGSSVEFVNQWMLTSLNLAFLALLLRDSRRPAVWHQVGAAAAVLLAPALYLAGVVNAVVFLVLWLGPPQLRRARRDAGVTRRSWAPCLVVAALFFAVVWLPYVLESGRLDLDAAPTRSAASGVLNAVSVAPLLPLALLRWSLEDGGFSMFSDPRILSPLSARLMEWARALWVAQWCVASSATALAFLRERRPGQARVAGGVPLLLGFIGLACVTAPLIRGPAWHRAERLDQTLQFLPLLLALSFGTPWWLRPANGWARRSTLVLAVAYSLVNAIAGVLVVNSHLAYRGPVINSADVPLRDVERVARWIAADSNATSAKREVRVAYALASGIWSWLPEFGPRLDPWYPGAMSVGRGFDYELARRHGLVNALEHSRARAPLEARYVVHYGFEPLAPCWPAPLRQVELGRLKVSVVR